MIECSPRSPWSCCTRLLGRARVVALACSTTVVLASSAAAAPHPDLKGTVVEVTAFTTPPDVTVPWQVAAVTAQIGSGVLIDQHRILTAAHVVADSAKLTVKRYGTTQLVGARVAFLCAECDLALLTVEDAAFFDGVVPMDIGDVPEPGDPVTAYGFPIGGKSLSVTAGIVSRLDVGAPDDPDDEVLVAQIDAALNEGNSGGPVTADGKLVGIARGILEGAQNVSYVVPVPVIRHFLTDVADGRLEGIPEFGLRWQEIENKALRKTAGLADDETGGLVTAIDYGSTAADVLQPGDVVLAIDGTAIAQDLTQSFPDVGRIDARYAATRKQVGEKIELRFIRNGERLVGTAVLRNLPHLVPTTARDARSYIVFGGLVFQPLTREYVEAFEQPSATLSAYTGERDLRTPERMQVIVIGSVLPWPVNRGYEGFADEVVARVNGRTPRDMHDLAGMLDSLPGPYVEIVSERGIHIVLDTARARAAGSKILKKHGIAHDRSRDLLEPRRTSRP